MIFARHPKINGLQYLGKCQKKPQNHEKNRKNFTLETESLRNIVGGGTLQRLLLRTTLRSKKPGKVLQKSPKATFEKNSYLAPCCTQTWARKV